VLALTLALALLAVPLAGRAQQPGKVYRIGYLSPGSGPDLFVDVFRQALRDRGYVEGQNLVIEYRWAAGNAAQLPKLAAELVRLQVDLIVAATSRPTLAARQASTTMPIVFLGISDPVAVGLVASLGRPGGNVTGLSDLGPDLAGKLLELLREIVPGVSRVAVVWNRGPGTVPIWKNLELVAPSLGVTVRSVEVREPSELDSLVGVLGKEHPGALIVMASPMTFQYRTRITDLVAKSRLPAIYEMKEFAEVGGLIAYGPSRTDIWRRGAVYVDRILKGAKPADLPIEQPTKFGMVVNLKTARALGLTIPPSVLARADEVIQ
jgi:ABC-type uncharacterized transport system substrate-binding protein